MFERPAKNPDNSSLPPSRGAKCDRPTGDKRARKSRPGVGRALEPNPDRVVDARLEVCPHCAADFPAEQQTPQQVYGRIELPPIKPDMTRVRLFGGRCACCGARATAASPSGLEPGSPFGQSIAALVVYLHYAHAIGLERLAALMGELFALSISEGAISNMLARAREPLLAAAAAIRETVMASDVGVLRRNLGAGDGGGLGGNGYLSAHWRRCTSFAQAVARPWCRRCSVPFGRRSGCPTCWAASVATEANGRCAWHICCVMHATRSSAAIPPSASRSNVCCCARSRSVVGETH